VIQFGGIVRKLLDALKRNGKEIAALGAEAVPCTSEGTDADVIGGTPKKIPMPLV